MHHPSRIISQKSCISSISCFWPWSVITAMRNNMDSKNKNNSFNLKFLKSAVYIFWYLEIFLFISTKKVGLKQLYNHCRPWAALQELSKLWWILLSPACGISTILLQELLKWWLLSKQGHFLSLLLAWGTTTGAVYLLSSLPKQLNNGTSAKADYSLPIQTHWPDSEKGVEENNLWASHKTPPLPEQENPPIPELSKLGLKILTSPILTLKICPEKLRPLYKPCSLFNSLLSTLGNRGSQHWIHSSIP